jgi:radical SAM-linked protein
VVREPVFVSRIRVRFSKVGKVRFTSHRDVARMWERALRRSSLRVQYTEGFSPRPKLHFGLALSNGHESLAEYLDIDLVNDVDFASLPERLTPTLPIGIEVAAAAPIERSAPSLQADVVACTWRFDLRSVAPELVTERVAALMASPDVMLTRSRKGVERNDDIRPAIETLDVTRLDDDLVGLAAVLATRDRGLRPNELLRALLPEVDDFDLAARVVRTHQWIEADGRRVEPLVAQLSPHAEVCA